MSKKWTVEEDKSFKKLYPHKKNSELAVIFNRPLKGISFRAWKLQLLKASKLKIQKEEPMIEISEGMRRIHSGIIQKNGNITIHRMA